MVSCLFMALLTLSYFIYFVNRVALKVSLSVLSTLGIYRLVILEKSVDHSFNVFWAFLRTFKDTKRSTIWLLKLQNDPSFTEDVKLFLGDVLGLDNRSPYIDLAEVAKMNFAEWKQRYKKTFQKFSFKLRATGRSHLSLCEYLRMLASKYALVLKLSINCSLVLVSVIKYIHHNGGLIGYAK